MKFHISWLETAINNLKNNPNKVNAVDGEMTINEFIQTYAEHELSQCVEIK